MSPILSTFAGASARGFSSNSGVSTSLVNVKFFGTFGANNGIGGTISDYINAASYNFYSSSQSGPFNALTTSAEFTRQGGGILQFNLLAGTYEIAGRSGSASQTSSYISATGAEVTATLTLPNETSLLLLIGNHGYGRYGGGGMTALAIGSDHSYNPVPIFVIGGGGAGYSSGNQNYQLPGPMTSSTSTASVRRGVSNSVAHDGGWGFFNTYTPNIQSSPQTTQGQHFVQGGQGNQRGTCNGGGGGFGGGGGPCPGGGGGYVGGYGGRNLQPRSSGGGGTSYYDSTYISNVVTVNVGSLTSNMGNLSTTTPDPAYVGYFGIVTA